MSRHRPCAGGAWGSSGRCLAHEGLPLGPDGKCDEGRSREAHVPYRLAEQLEGLSVVVLDGDAVDWTSIAPHPRLAEMAQLCASCGALRGEHAAAAPHGATLKAPSGGEVHCFGFRAASPEVQALYDAGDDAGDAQTGGA